MSRGGAPDHVVSEANEVIDIRLRLVAKGLIPISVLIACCLFVFVFGFCFFVVATNF
jgi:hypothetical protein